MYMSRMRSIPIPPESGMEKIPEKIPGEMRGKIRGVIPGGTPGEILREIPAA
jgi:hypothetical protein